MIVKREPALSTAGATGRVDNAPAPDPVPRAVPESGGEALQLMGSRVATLYLVGVLVAALLSPPRGHPGRWAATAAVLALAVVGIGGGLARSVRPGRALLIGACALAAMAALAGWHPSLDRHDAQILIGSVASAAAAGTALAWGPLPGLAATAWVLVAWAGPVHAIAHELDGPLFAGALVGGLLGATASLLLRRGYTVTQRALVAAEEAVTARAVAAARWRARRSEIRTLHDTVLSTLSLLSSGGHGVDEDALRADCRVQARLLREADLRSLAVAARPSEPGASDGAADALEPLRRRWAARSLDVRVYGDRQARNLAGASPAAASALLGAVEECLENVRRHADVEVVSVVVVHAGSEIRCMVTDEGRGFDARNPSAQRIGLSDSVLGRISEQGGTARLWSAPGSGTSVALSVPIGTPPDRTFR